MLKSKWILILKSNPNKSTCIYFFWGERSTYILIPLNLVFLSEQHSWTKLLRFQLVNKELNKENLDHINSLQ